MTDEQNPDAEGESTDASPSDEARGSGMGQILGLLVVMLIGAVIVYLGYAYALAPPSLEEEDTGEVLEERTLFERAELLQIGDIMTNVDGEQGRRYVKVTVDLWIPTERVEDMTRPGVDTLIKQAMEERLAQWNLKELSDPDIYDVMKKAFAQEINKVMREINRTTDTDLSYIERVVLSNKHVQ